MGPLLSKMHGMLLTNIDVGTKGALLRLGTAGAFATALQRLRPETSLPAATLALALLLFALKASAAVGRRVVPLPPAVRAQQEWRRNLARFHDSYQVAEAALVRPRDPRGHRGRAAARAVGGPARRRLCAGRGGRRGRVAPQGPAGRAAAGVTARVSGWRDAR